MNIPDEIKSAFPVEIDLALPGPSPVANDKSTKASKPSYPTFYIGAADGLDQLPDEGYALIYFKRRRVTMSVNDNGETDHSADLEVQEICLPAKSEAEDSDDLMGAAKSVAKGMGVDTGDQDDSDDSDDDEDEEPAPDDEELENKP